MNRTHEIRLTELDAAAIVPSASIDPPEANGRFDL